MAPSRSNLSLKCLVLAQLMNLICQGAATLPDQGYYRAAVVDYTVLGVGDVGLTPHEIMMRNVMNYESFISMAATQKADIIVFPENGLIYSDWTVFLTVPDPSMKIIPAGNASYDLVLQTLSRYAMTNQIYIVVNFHEKYTDPSTKETLKYNTNVVFDRNGTVISRYRKFNLWGEKPLNVTKDPEYSIFETDFNVKFGQFICFDILFKEPALTLIRKYNISNFIFPSQWFSELPFLASIQTQWMWAVGNNVNLLSSGNRNITRGNTGSSIIRGARSYEPLFSFSDTLGNSLLVGNVPTGPADYPPFTHAQPDIQGHGHLFLLQQPDGLTESNSKPIHLPISHSTTLENVVFSEQLCHGELCCTFHLRITYDPNRSEPMMFYRAAVFDGAREFGLVTAQHDIEYCGILSCTSDDINGCGKLPNTVFSDNTTRLVQFDEIRIFGNFLTADANPLPNVLLWPGNNLSFLANPTDVTFASNETSSHIEYNKGKQIITVGIHSRIFSRGRAAGMYSTYFVVLIAILIPAAIKYLK